MTELNNESNKVPEFQMDWENDELWKEIDLIKQKQAQITKEHLECFEHFIPPKELMLNEGNEEAGEKKKDDTFLKQQEFSAKKDQELNTLLHKLDDLNQTIIKFHQKSMPGFEWTISESDLNINNSFAQDFKAENLSLQTTDLISPNSDESDILSRTSGKQTRFAPKIMIDNKTSPKTPYFDPLDKSSYFMDFKQPPDFFSSNSVNELSQRPLIVQDDFLRPISAPTKEPPRRMSVQPMPISPKKLSPELEIFEEEDTLKRQRTRSKSAHYFSPELAFNKPPN